MKKFAAIVTLALGCVVGWGQKDCPSKAWIGDKCLPFCTDSTSPFQEARPSCKERTLQCGKYQHQQITPAHCANTCAPGATVCTDQCLYIPERTECVDDLHVVTEREWQELITRIKTLELKK
jgi:hypothetical protein